MCKTPIAYLLHILEECNYILSVVTDDLPMYQFLSDETLKRAVCRSLEIVLCRFFLFVRAVCAGNRSFNLLSVGAGQLFLCFDRLHSFFLVFSEQPVQPAFDCRKQCVTPPRRDLPAAPIRHRSY